MKLTPQEKAARRAAFQALSPEKKREHIWEYYKWPILLGLLALLILCSTLHRQLTRREPVLYLALANVSVGDTLERELTEGFLSSVGLDARRCEVYLYPGLYLSDDADTLNHEYAYASKMKLTGALAARKLDVVLMNGEAYTLLSQQGYLLDMRALAGESAALLAENEVILSDNSLELALGEAEELHRVTETAANALSVSSLPLFRAAGFDGELYLGVIANTERPEAAAAFAQYLLESGSTDAVEMKNEK